MKKIAYILATDHIAGTEVHVLNLIGEIKEKYDITVISDGGEFGKKVGELGIKSQVINLKNINLLKAVINLYKNLKKERYDIIHLHLPKSFLIGAIAGRIYGKCNIIMTEHLWSSYNSEYSVLKNKIHLLIYRILSFFVDDIIVVSESVKNFLEKEIKVKENKINLIYNGSNKKINLKERDFLYKDKIIFGIVGRLSKEKSHDKLIDIFKEIDDKRIILKIIGKGELEKKIKTKIEENELENKIEIVGFVDNKDKIYNSIDVLLLSSERECFPMVIIEAMSYGIPVIATNVGGVKEAIKNYKTGRVIEYFDKNEYKNAILEICEVSTFKKYSINSQKRFEKYFDIDNMVKKTLKLYEKSRKK